MSKVGNQPVSIDKSINVIIEENNLLVKGSAGEVHLKIPKGINIERNEQQITISTKRTDIRARSNHGLIRSLIANAVSGAKDGWSKTLEIVGTGYRAKLQGEDLVFEVGFSHPVTFKQVAGLKYSIKGNNLVTVTGADKQLVGSIAYQIRCIRKPDAYKGKGIRYQGEFIKLKPGKKVVTGSA